jgi:hypothetical protein
MSQDAGQPQEIEVKVCIWRSYEDRCRKTSEIESFDYANSQSGFVLIYVYKPKYEAFLYFATFICDLRAHIGLEKS